MEETELALFCFHRTLRSVLSALPPLTGLLLLLRIPPPELYHTHLSALIPVWHIQHFPGRSARTQLLSHLSSPSQCTGKQKSEVFSASVMAFVHLKLPSGFSLNLSFQFSCSSFWRLQQTPTSFLPFQGIGWVHYSLGEMVLGITTCIELNSNFPKSCEERHIHVPSKPSLMTAHPIYV